MQTLDMMLQPGLDGKTPFKRAVERDLQQVGKGSHLNSLYEATTPSYGYFSACLISRIFLYDCRLSSTARCSSLLELASPSGQSLTGPGGSAIPTLTDSTALGKMHARIGQPISTLLARKR